MNPGTRFVVGVETPAGRVNVAGNSKGERMGIGGIRICKTHIKPPLEVPLAVCTGLPGVIL
jgi:hypothetical protein